MHVTSVGDKGRGRCGWNGLVQTRMINVGMGGVLFLDFDFDGVMNTPGWCRAKGAGLPPGERVR